MSNVILSEDIEHGTPEGYKAGCRGTGCPAGREYGFSCSKAAIENRSNFTYRKLRSEGLTPAQIAERLAAPAAPAKAEAPRPKARPRPPAPRPVQDETPAVPPAPPVPEPASAAPAPTPTEPKPERPPRTSQPAPKATQAEIRAWARERGYEVSERGVVRREISDHYYEVHGAPAPTPAPVRLRRKPAPSTAKDPRPEWAHIAEVSSRAELTRAIDNLAQALVLVGAALQNLPMKGDQS